MSSADDRRPDDYVGHTVRPYALIGGRTRPSGEGFDLLSLVGAVRGARDGARCLGPEHQALLRLCRIPTSVADLAAELDLPLGVIQILLSDLRELKLVAVHSQAPARPNDPQFLREVADALRQL